MIRRVLPAGDRGLFVYFEPRIDPEVNRAVHRLAGALAEAGIPGLSEIIPSYHALYLEFDPLVTSVSFLEKRCREWAGRGEAEETGEEWVVELPVAYGGEFGPDLEDVARLHGLSPEEVIDRHAGREYYVFFLGFTPGFPYLGGLDPALATPRLATPRPRVAAGSVGIAGEQTGVYPIASPAGWRIIGRTPLALFRPDRDPPVLLRPGHWVRFVRIPPQAFFTWDRYADISPRRRQGGALP